MTTPLPRTTSDTARLLNGAPSFAVGWQERILVPNPAAGLGFTYKGDGRFYERVLAVWFSYVSDAVAGSRFPQVTLKDNNGVTIAQVPAASSIAASTTVFASLVIGAPAYAAGTVGLSCGFLPDILIPPDWSWSLAMTGADAGDQVSAVVFLVQRFPNDAAAVSSSS